jgi:hypothetical protein
VNPDIFERGPRKILKLGDRAAINLVFLEPAKNARSDDPFWVNFLEDERIMDA